MELCECDISLKTVRAYRDCAEVLLLAKPRVRHEHQQRAHPRSTEAWGISLGALSDSERRSLKVLCPQLSMLHLEWIDRDVLERSKAAINETDPVKPLSLPPPKLSSRPKITESHQTLTSDLGAELEIDHTLKTDLLPKEIRSRTVQTISSERAKYDQESPQSVVDIKRRLLITETLNSLERRWGDEIEREPKVEIDSSLSQTSQPSKTAHSSEPLSPNIERVLCLYFQRGEEPGQSPIPPSLHGGWIDSVKPKGISPVEELSSLSAASLNDKKTGGVWLRLVLSSAHWTPSVQLSLHGDMGRLSVFSYLNSDGLLGLVKGSKATQSPEEEVKIEWIDDCLLSTHHLHHRENQSRESYISLADLYKGEGQSRPSVCFESVMLMSRTLRDFEGERERIQSSDHRVYSSDDARTDIDNADALEVGYFTEYIQYRYPPALVSGKESALRGQRKLKLCLPPLSPFLEELLGIKSETAPPWSLIIKGLSRQGSPQHERHHIISFELGEAEEVIVTRGDHGLRFTSHLTHVCRIGVMTIDGSTLIDEIELQPLGVGALKQLEQMMSTLSQSQEVSR